jgi:hypothetical protein
MSPMTILNHNHARGMLLAACLILAPSGVHAQAQTGPEIGYHGWGPRLGVTSGPDQVHFGAHFDLGDVVSRVRFRPSFEIGFGDSRTLASLNVFDLAYRFPTSGDRWMPYLGGGIGVFVDGRGSGHGSDTEVGASLLGGVETRLGGGNRVFFEARVGVADAPDLKLSVGWMFY